MQILAFVNTNINVADQFFTSMCFESKKWVSMLVPCVLELYLELRRFMSMGKCCNTKYRGTSIVIVPYIRHNAVHTAQSRMPYEICRTGVRILSTLIAVNGCIFCFLKLAALSIITRF